MFEQTFKNIDETVERIKDDTITQYIYDPQTVRLVKRAAE